MKVKVMLLYICLLPFFGIDMKADEPRYVEIANKITNITIERLEKKHHLHCCGIKRGMNKSVELIGLDFQLNRIMEKNEARGMVVNCVQEFLADINRNEEIRKVLQVYPFDPEHIEVVIYLSTHDYGTIYHPDLAIVAARRGKITYSTNDPDNEFNFKSREVESFEEAVKIVQSHHKQEPQTN